MDEHTQGCHPLGEELKAIAHGFITELIPVLHKIHEEQCNQPASVLPLNRFNF